MTVKLYERSVVRQYTKARSTNYGVKLWGLCYGCCGYSLTQNLLLGSSAGSVSGRDVVIELTEQYFDKGHHAVHCDRFFYHLSGTVFEVEKNWDGGYIFHHFFTT